MVHGPKALLTNLPGPPHTHSLALDPASWRFPQVPRASGSQVCDSPQKHWAPQAHLLSTTNSLCAFPSRAVVKCLFPFASHPEQYVVKCGPRTPVSRSQTLGPHCFSNCTMPTSHKSCGYLAKVQISQLPPPKSNRSDSLMGL